MPRDHAGNSLNQAHSLKNVPGRNVDKDWIGQSDKTDFYTFTLSKSSSIKLSLGKLKRNLDLELLDFQGTRIAHSSNPGSSRERVRETLEAGTYYIKVSRRRGSSSYRLKTVLREVPDSAGPDSTVNNAPSLPPPIQNPTGMEGSVAVEDDATPAERVNVINQILGLTNDERAKNGLSPLTLNPLLNNAAQMQSADLALNDFFAHTSPTGTSLADRLNAAGYVSYQVAGENIAAGQITAAQVVQEWMASPGHRANILNPNFTELGVGYYFLANDTGEVNYNRYWTQNFGNPVV